MARAASTDTAKQAGEEEDAFGTLDEIYETGLSTGTVEPPPVSEEREAAENIPVPMPETAETPKVEKAKTETPKAEKEATKQPEKPAVKKPVEKKKESAKKAPPEKPAPPKRALNEIRGKILVVDPVNRQLRITTDTGINVEFPFTRKTAILDHVGKAASVDDLAYDMQVAVRYEGRDLTAIEIQQLH